MCRENGGAATAAQVVRFDFPVLCSQPSVAMSSAVDSSMSIPALRLGEQPGREDRGLFAAGTFVRARASMRAASSPGPGRMARYRTGTMQAQ